MKRIFRIVQESAPVPMNECEESEDNFENKIHKKVQTQFKFLQQQLIQSKNQHLEEVAAREKNQVNFLLYFQVSKNQ